MLSRLTLLLSMLCFVMSGAAQGIPARLAAGKGPRTPNFKQIHLAFTRIIKNEAGWRNQADVNGIGQVVLRLGGGRNRARSYRGSGYGLDYRQFMRGMAKASPKTFPAKSDWVTPHILGRYGTKSIAKARVIHRKRQKANGNAYWTHTMKHDCSKPGHWDEVYPLADWAGYEKRCPELFEMTEAWLKGKLPNWCVTSEGDSVRPLTWGSRTDKGWIKRELTRVWCDQPDATWTDREGITHPDCTDYDYRQDPNNQQCARNRFYYRAPAPPKLASNP